MPTIQTGPNALVETEPTLTAMLVRRIAETPDRDAYRYPIGDGEWATMTWAQAGEDAAEIAAGLISLGIEAGERVGIAAETSIEWILSELGVVLAGGAITTVYSSTGAEDVAYILGDSNTKVLFAQDEKQLAKVLEQKDNLPELGKVVLFNGEGDGDFAITMAELRTLGRAALDLDPELVANRAASVTPDQIATLIYTSGTTGKPKGVELLQGAWSYVSAALRSLDVITIDDVQYLWLPMAHVFGSVLVAFQIEVGYVTAVDGNVGKIMENLTAIKPTFMGAVPRIFEKLYAAMAAMAKAGGPEKEAGFAWGVDIGRQYEEALLAGEEPSPELAAQYEQANELVLTPIRAALGGNMRFFISGSAPLASEVAQFFAAAGMPVLEGYGLTETSAIVTISRPTSLKSGTVGEPHAGTEVMIADDGEIMVRSPAVMNGYRNQPEANAEVFIDGWFATGDIGEFDEYGRLKITDRKKDLFKTSGGKYVAPSAIESQFKAICGLASNMVVHANNRKFVSAIITLDPEAVAMWAAPRGKPIDIASASQDPELLATIDACVDELNSRLNAWEQIKKFVVLDHDFSIDDGELTPSLKVKRKVVEQRNKELLDSLYA